ncbi:MAG: hypothetical protein JWO22_1936 [Frankiales bacterium]|nr:hypothetical protein [Frankiales bacterium]
MERAVAKALGLSFVAQVVALLTGKVPWLAAMVVIASASYLVEAVERWKQDRTPLAPVVALVPSAATSFSLSAGGTRSLSALQQPRRAGDAPEQRRDGLIEMVDLHAELADDRDQLLQGA